MKSISSQALKKLNIPDVLLLKLYVIEQDKLKLLLRTLQSANYSSITEPAMG